MTYAFTSWSKAEYQCLKILSDWEDVQAESVQQVM